MCWAIAAHKAPCAYTETGRVRVQLSQWHLPALGCYNPVSGGTMANRIGSQIAGYGKEVSGGPR
jgi:hypothetical protein